MLAQRLVESRGLTRLVIALGEVRCVPRRIRIETRRDFDVAGYPFVAGDFAL